MWAFQSTLPRRERPCQGRPSASCHWHFNPRSREGSDGTGRQPRPSCPEFQSTLPRRERQLRVRPAHEQNLFQSTLPRRERPLHPEYHPPQYHFNPRSREGSDLGTQQDARPEQQFQSTLPRRERRVRSAVVDGIIRFQSTLPRRERRPANGRFRCAPPHFNPRSREGSDSTLCGGNLFLICISIHAPAKGATLWTFLSTARPHFNPRSREGSDIFMSDSTCLLLTFQSTLPRRERLRCYQRQAGYRTFQSTLPRRERPRRSARCSARANFNPRSREGSDDWPYLQIHSGNDFNPRSREGSDSR